MNDQLDRIEKQLKAITRFLESLGMGKTPRRTISEIDAQVGAKLFKMKLTRPRKKG